MKKGRYVLAVCLLAGLFLTGCKQDQGDDEARQQRLSKLEIYSNSGELVNTIEEKETLIQFNSLESMDVLDDTEVKQAELKDITEGCSVLYTIASYKTPAAAINDGSLKKGTEITVYEDSDIIKEQIMQEEVKGADVPEEYLTFYIEVSKEDKEFLLSLAAIF